MGNYSDITNSLVTIGYLVVGLLFPIIGLFLIFRNKKLINEESVQRKLKVYIEGIRTSKMSRMLYNFFFLMRKLVTGFVLVII